MDENHRLAMEAESRRLAILEEEAKTAAKHVNNIEQTQEEMFGMSYDMVHLGTCILHCNEIETYCTQIVSKLKTFERKKKKFQTDVR